MTVRSPSTTADVVPQQGMRKVGGWGLRGWRVHCAECGYLSEQLFTHLRSAQRDQHAHRCQAAA